MLQLIENEPLAKYTTFKIGGPADYFYVLKGNHELPELIEYCKAHNLPYFIFGSGSNILFHDNGFRGVVIKLESKNIEIGPDYIEADAGVLISDLLKQMLENNLSGLEPWVGLPGTVGAAVRGNAGCNGLETKDCLISAQVFTPETGQIEEKTPEYFQFAYRESIIKKNYNIVLSAKFKIHPLKRSKEEQTEEISKIRKERFRKQPFGVCTTGSFFKNPLPEKPAGLLIDQAGLKGTSIGGAQISEKHGNFFINTGNATAQNILDLCVLAQKTVKEKFDLELEPEVQVIPEKP